MRREELVSDYDWHSGSRSQILILNKKKNIPFKLGRITED